MLAGELVICEIGARAGDLPGRAAHGVGRAGPAARDLPQGPHADGGPGGGLSLERIFIRIDEHAEFAGAVPRGAGLGRAQREALRGHGVYLVTGGAVSLGARVTTAFPGPHWRPVEQATLYQISVGLPSKKPGNIRDFRQRAHVKE